MLFGELRGLGGKYFRGAGRSESQVQRVRLGDDSGDVKLADRTTGGRRNHLRPPSYFAPVRSEWLAYHKSIKGKSMRKQIVSHQSRKPSPTDTSWLHLEDLAQVEITSEDSANPVESALTPGHGSGWRAAEPGEQMLRLLFDKPLSLRHLRLKFREEEVERTQEFLLRWSSDGGTSYREIVRQQYNFSPTGRTNQVEDYFVELDGVTALELSIVPDISGGSARASLEQLQLA
jgi:hypothetical protein